MSGSGLDLAELVRPALAVVTVCLVVLLLVVAVHRSSAHLFEARRDDLVRRTRPLLLQVLADDEPDPDALSALAALPDSEWRVLEPTIVSMLGKVRGGARAALADVLTQRGTLDRARERTRARSWVRRCEAAEMLGAARQPDCLTALVPLLQDRRAEVRQVAARAMGRIGAEAAAPALLAAASGSKSLPARDVASALVLLEPSATPRIVGVAAAARDPQLRSVAAEVLGLRGAVEGTGLLMALLDQDEHLEVRTRSARALGRLGVRASVGPLTAALTADSAELRAVAAKALGQIGSAEGVVPLVACLEDPSHRVAVNAAEALAATGAHGLAALRGLASTSTRPAGYARQALAMHGLGRGPLAGVGG